MSWSHTKKIFSAQKETKERCWTGQGTMARAPDLHKWRRGYPISSSFLPSWRPKIEVNRQRAHSKPTARFRMEQRGITSNKMASLNSNNSKGQFGKVFSFGCSFFGWFRICFVAGSRAATRTLWHPRTCSKRIRK